MTRLYGIFKFGLLLVSLIYLGACASVSPDGTPDPDPWQGWNKPVYSFNDKIDRYLLRPVAVGYRGIMPDAGERAVDRFFDNLGEVSNAVNNLLQGEPTQAASSTGRLLINSTLGVAGLFEVAESMGLEKSDGEDFGQTLGKWGVGSGPYLVLPFLGPSTLRDTPTRVVDWYTDPASYIDDNGVRNSLTAAELISTRAGLLDTERLISGDPYIFVRDAYLQRREFLIKDGQIQDDYDDFLDDDF